MVPASLRCPSLRCQRAFVAMKGSERRLMLKPGETRRAITIRYMEGGQTSRPKAAGELRFLKHEQLLRILQQPLVEDPFWAFFQPYIVQVRHLDRPQICQ